MLTIYNFSFHKLPQYGYDRQKKKDETAISPLLTFNLKVGFTFSVLSPSACFNKHQCINALKTHQKNRPFDVPLVCLWYA